MRPFVWLALIGGCIPDPGPSVFDADGDYDGDGRPNSDDCDPESADTAGVVTYADADGDGYGDPNAATSSCTAAVDAVLDGTDCDDSDPEQHPGQVWIIDFDRDGYPWDGWAVNADPLYIPAVVITACARPAPFVDEFESPHPYLARPSDDCHDDLSFAYPGAPSWCSNDVDDDCDGVVDRCALAENVGPGAALGHYFTRDDDGTLGSQLAAVGDLDGDGNVGFAVGSTGADTVALVELVFDDGALTDTETLNVTGIPPRDGAQTRAAGAGDLDNDGFDDLIVAAVADGGETKADAWLLFGPFTDDRDVSTGVHIGSTTDTTQLGWRIGRAGDLDDDGFDDVILTDPDLIQAEGRAYVIWGDDALADRAGLVVQDDAGWILNGTYPYDDGLGASFAPVDDVDGDGIDDLALGTFGYAPQDTMTAYLIPGDPAAGGIEQVGDVAGCRYITPDVATGERPLGGIAIAGVGDVDDDGRSEILIGAHGSHSEETEGHAWLVFDGIFGCASSGDIVLGGAVPGHVAEFVDPGVITFGSTVAGLGDADGDGVPDLAIGAPYAKNGNLEHAGAVFLVSSAPIVAGLRWDVTDSDGDRVVWSRIRGSTAYQYFGTELLAPGDLDGDQLGDLLVGDLRRLLVPADPDVHLFLNGIEE